jgi:HEAT repeat protein
MKQILSVLLFFIFISVSVFGQSNNSTESDTNPAEDNEKKVEDTDYDKQLREERLNILNWGTSEDVKDLILKLIGEKDSSYNSDIVNLLDSSIADGVVDAVFKYLKEFKLTDAVDYGLDVLKYFDEYPDATVRLVLEYYKVIADTTKFPTDLAEILWYLIEGSKTPLIIQSLSLLQETEKSEYSDKLMELYNKDYTDIKLKPYILRTAAFFQYPEALEEIKKILKDENSDKSLRWEACKSIAEYKEQTGIEKTVADLLKDSDPYLRMYAYETLYKISNNTEKYFKNSFRDSFWKIRQSAVRAAGEQQFEQYVDVLKYIADNDREGVIKKDALFSLGKIGGSSSIEFLKNILYSRAKSPEIRKIAAEALDISGADNFYGKLVTIFDEKLKDNLKKSLLAKISDLYNDNDYNPDLQIFYQKCINSKEFVLKVNALRWILHTGTIFNEELIREWAEKEKKNLVGRLSRKILNL